MPEAEPLVEALGRVVVLDVDRHRLLRGLAFGEDLRHEHPPDAAAADLGDERDVDDPDVLLAAIDVEPADGPSLQLDDQERAAGVVLLVVRLLRRELHVEEPAFLLVGPRNGPQFVFAGRAVEISQERHVIVGARPEGDCLAAWSTGCRHETGQALTVKGAASAEGRAAPGLDRRLDL